MASLRDCGDKLLTHRWSGVEAHFWTIFFLVFFNTLVGVRTVPRIFEQAVRAVRQVSRAERTAILGGVAAKLLKL